MIKLKPLSVFALASFTFAGCGDDTTPANDETSETGTDDDSDDATVTVTLTTVDPTTIDPSDPTEADTTIDPTVDPTIDPTDPDTTIDPTEAETTDAETTDAETTDGESSSSTSDTGVSDCAVVMIDGDFARRSSNAFYQFTGTDLVGDALLEDVVQVEFWGSIATGEFDLTIPPDDNYATCERCIRLFQDVDGKESGPQFFQSAGTIDIDPQSVVLSGYFRATLNGVRLVEVEVDPDTAESTPVPDGACVDIVDGTIGSPVVPAEWACPPQYYNTGFDNDCDCGCGVIDPDCVDLAADSCNFCSEPGSCNDAVGCPGNIDPDDNTTCVEGPEVPAGWTCDPEFYNSGFDDDCDCGCGVIDPDCVDALADSCDFCSEPGSCNEDAGACPGEIDPDDNSTCVGGPVDAEVIVAGPGLAVAIPDAAYTGALDSMACVDLEAVGDGNVAGVEIELAAAHTWVGDTIVKIVSPAGTVVTLMSRPGVLEPTDTGIGGGFGDSADLSAAFPVTFADGGVTDAETMGASLLSSDDVVCEDDGLCSYFPNPGAATPGNLSTFNGEAATGTWQLCIGDRAQGDTGTIDTVTLTIAQD